MHRSPSYVTHSRTRHSRTRLSQRPDFAQFTTGLGLILAKIHEETDGLSGAVVGLQQREAASRFTIIGTGEFRGDPPSHEQASQAGGGT